jgi:hypothetical protein
MTDRTLTTKELTTVMDGKVREYLTANECAAEHIDIAAKVTTATIKKLLDGDVPFTSCIYAVLALDYAFKNSGFKSRIVPGYSVFSVMMGEETEEVAVPHVWVEIDEKKLDIGGYVVFAASPDADMLTKLPRLQVEVPETAYGTHSAAGDDKMLKIERLIRDSKAQPDFWEKLKEECLATPCPEMEIAIDIHDSIHEILNVD